MEVQVAFGEVGMNRKAIVVAVAVVIVVVGGAILFMFMRSQRPFRGMMGGPAQGPASGQSARGLVAVSADGTPLPPAVGATPASENMCTQTISGLRVSLALSPYPPAGFQTSNFEVTLVDANNQAVTDATVNLDLTMPGMWMPPNAVTAPHAGNGVYRGSGRFTMRGVWRIEVILQRSGQKQSAFFQVNL